MLSIRVNARESGPWAHAISLIALLALDWSSLSLGREQVPLVDWTSVGDQMSPVIVWRMIRFPASYWWSSKVLALC